MNRIQKINKLLKKSELTPDEIDSNIMFQLAQWVNQSIYEMIDYRFTPDEISEWFADDIDDMLDDLDISDIDEYEQRVKNLVETKTESLKSAIYNVMKTDNELLHMIVNNSVIGLKKSFE